MRTSFVEIPVTLRHKVGKNDARQLRKAGQVPAAVYGRGIVPLPVAVEEKVFLSALPRGAWLTTPLRLNIQGESADISDRTPTVMVAEVQRNILVKKLYSIDFHVVSLEEKVRVMAPIRHTGESPGVARGGIVEVLMYEVMVEALPEDLPDQFEVDISGLDFHDQIKVGDLQVPEGVTVLSPPEEAILVIAIPRKIEEVEVSEVVEAEEPELVQPETT